MAKKHGKKDYNPHISSENAPPCDIGGCGQPGVYKAPRSKNQLDDYRWLCLDHIRQFNQQWDFFKGMERGEIEAFMRDAITGHRPTWSREARLREPMPQLQDALYEFLSHTRKKSRPPPPVSAKLRKALSMMDMDYPFTAAALKTRYRELVKKNHPDVNKGDKLAEERFKKITECYHLLSNHLKK